MKNTIIVVGGGIAGLSAAQAARKQDGEARILLYHAERYLDVYKRQVYGLGLAAAHRCVQHFDALVFQRLGNLLGGQGIDAAHIDKNRALLDLSLIHI